MRIARKVAVLLTACAMAVGVTGCSQSDGAGVAVKFPVSESSSISGSPTLDAAKGRGSIRIGVKEDQPGLGYLDLVTGERTGFDIQIATWVSAEMGFSDKQINFVKVPSANREQALINGDIDLYVGTYSITDKRKEQVGFAGPYFVTGQGLLVHANEQEIRSKDDLPGKNVCSATGSTPIQNIKKNFPQTRTTEFDTYSQCVEALKDGSTGALTTDQAILLGFAADDPDNLKVVGEPFTTEKYGIAVPHDDKALRHGINQILTNGGETWKKIYDSTLGTTGVKVDQPKVDDYE